MRSMLQPHAIQVVLCGGIRYPVIAAQRGTPHVPTLDEGDLLFGPVR